MYLWLVLSTFLAILAGYVIPFRSDADKYTDEPVATANAMRMVINHKLALKHLNLLKWPYACLGELYPDGSCDIEDRVSFKVGEVTPEEINDTHPLFNYDENYTTYVFCYNSDGTVSGQWCFDLTSGARRRYVVTYGDLHDKWLSFQSNDECSPDGNVLNGIKGHFSGDILIGYVKPNGDDTASLVNSIGQVIYDFDTNMYATMDENCNLRCNGSCIAFVSEL